MTPEAKVKKKIKDILTKLGAYYTMPVTGGYGKSGAPDFLVCYKGSFIGIEAKAGNNRPTKLQELNMEQIRAAGGKTFVINEENIDDLWSINT